MRIELQEITHNTHVPLQARSIPQQMRDLEKLAKTQLEDGGMLTHGSGPTKELDSLSRKIRQVALGKVESLRAEFYAEKPARYYEQGDKVIVFVATISRVLQASANIPEAIVFRGLELLLTTEEAKVIQAFKRFQGSLEMPIARIAQFPQEFQQTITDKLTAALQNIPYFFAPDAPEHARKALERELTHWEGHLSWMHDTLAHITTLKGHTPLQELLKVACKNLGDPDINHLLKIKSLWRNSQ